MLTLLLALYIFVSVACRTFVARAMAHAVYVCSPRETCGLALGLWAVATRSLVVVVVVFADASSCNKLVDVRGCLCVAPHCLKINSTDATAHVAASLLAEIVRSSDTLWGKVRASAGCKSRANLCALIWTGFN